MFYKEIFNKRSKSSTKKFDICSGMATKKSKAEKSKFSAIFVVR